MRNDGQAVCLDFEIEYYGNGSFSDVIWVVLALRVSFGWEYT